MTGTGIPPEIEDWFAGRGWRVRDHQRAMLEASDRGDHALLVADTGAGPSSSSGSGGKGKDVRSVGLVDPQQAWEFDMILVEPPGTTLVPEL